MSSKLKKKTPEARKKPVEVKANYDVQHIWNRITISLLVIICLVETIGVSVSSKSIELGGVAFAIACGSFIVYQLDVLWAIGLYIINLFVLVLFCGVPTTSISIDLTLCFIALLIQVLKLSKKHKSAALKFVFTFGHVGDIDKPKAEHTGILEKLIIVGILVSSFFIVYGNGLSEYAAYTSEFVRVLAVLNSILPVFIVLSFCFQCDITTMLEIIYCLTYFTQSAAAADDGGMKLICQSIMMLVTGICICLVWALNENERKRVSSSKGKRVDKGKSDKK